MNYYVDMAIGLALSAAIVGYTWRMALIVSQAPLARIPGMMAKAYLLSLGLCLLLVMGAFVVLGNPRSWLSPVVFGRIIGCWLVTGAFIGLWLSLRSSRAKRVDKTSALDR